MSMTIERSTSMFCRAASAVTIAALVAAALIGGAASDAAAASKIRVGVPSLKGSGEGMIRAAISKVLKANGLQVVGSSQIDAVATNLGVMVDSDEGLSAVAKELNIAAFVTGEASKKRVTLAVRNGADGAVIGRASFPGANVKAMQSAVGAGFWRLLGGAIGEGQPPAGAKTKAVVAPEPESPAEEPAEAAAPAARAGGESTAEVADQPIRPARRRAVRPPPAESAPAADADREAEAEDKPIKVAAKKSKRRRAKPLAEEPAEEEEDDGGKALFRRLSWHQDPEGRLAPYSLAPGPEAAVWLEIYPASFTSGAFGANVGLFGSFDNGFGVTSTTRDGSRLTTSFRDYQAGLKLRLPTGAFSPNISLAYGGQSFSLQARNGTLVVPGVDYRFIRAAIGAHVTFTRSVLMDLGFGYLSVSDPGAQAGQIGSSTYFPRALAYAVDVGVSLTVRLGDLLAVRAGGDLRQYGLDLRAHSSDPLKVGGAVDRYISVWGGLEVILDGQIQDTPAGGGGGGGDDDEKEPGESPPPAKDKGSKAAPASDPDAEE
jgi:hypothetical protein